MGKGMCKRAPMAPFMIMGTASKHEPRTVMPSALRQSKPSEIMDEAFCQPETLGTIVRSLVMQSVGEDARDDV